MKENLGKIDHIVVLMLENRSFDQVAGYLYDPLNKPPFDKVPRGQPFEGVSGKPLSNPIPPLRRTREHNSVPVARGYVDTNPNPDPGETYQHVNRQLFGDSVNPFKSKKPSMNGFVADYIKVLQEERLKAQDISPIKYEDYKIIMECFTPETLPVLSLLAHSYAICDQWFSSVPSQTWTNRSFFHAATSSGLVNNFPYIDWLDNDADTIFNRISTAGRPGLNWKVYHDKGDFVPLTLLIHLRRLWSFRKTNFFLMDQFYEDAKQGTLPSYSFIEPQFYGPNSNDMHPPYSVLAGERLIYNVYQALRTGKNWGKTLLIVTFDEHGGCYDHVPPPKATPPARKAPPGQFGFRFDRLGVRVCTLLISPYIESGTVFRAKNEKGEEIPIDHTSVIKTITARWGLQDLTERDRAAIDLSQVLTRSQPRTDHPILNPLPVVTTQALRHQLVLALERDVSSFVEDLINYGLQF